MNRILATTITNIYKIKLKIMLLNFVNLPIIFRIYTFVRSCQFIVRFYLESKKIKVNSSRLSSSIRVIKKIRRVSNVSAFLYFKLSFYHSTIIDLPLTSLGLVGIFFGRSIRNIPLFILAVTSDDNICSGIGIVR